MAVYSMTGYASAQSTDAPAPAEGEQKPGRCARLGLEIRSVNSRFLDLAFRLPDELRKDEARLRERLTARLILLHDCFSGSARHKTKSARGCRKPRR
jgi:uncharacterized protein YicC (UPF0701 family)